MSNITLGDIDSWLTFILGLGASIGAIVHFVKKAVEKLLVPYGLDNAKNYIVPFLSKVDRGEAISDIELERFHEEYEYYTNHGGNSYIKSKVEKLKEEKKL